MDTAICICAGFLVILFMLETALMLGVRKKKPDITAFVTVIPVIPGDCELRERLSAVTDKIALGELFYGRLLLVDYGADDEQRRICETFCELNCGAQVVQAEEFTDMLPEIFDISMQYKD